MKLTQYENTRIIHFEASSRGDTGCLLSIICTVYIERETERAKEGEREDKG